MSGHDFFDGWALWQEIVHSRCWPDDLALARFKDYEDA